jgi:SAM-dependent methyltransferase
VVAADIDCRFLTGLPSNVEVRELDVRHDEREPEGYDLVHCRALLNHVPDPAAVLRRMVDALRPGGVLLAEEGDLGLLADGGHPDAQWASERHQMFEALAPAKALRGYLGRTLPGMLIDAGLGPARCEVETTVARPGDPAFDFWRRTWAEITPAMVTGGLLTGDDRDRIDAVIECPTVVLTMLSAVAAWARRPARSSTER